MRATAFVLSFSALASLAAAAVDDATLASLKTELLAWKSSPAGLQAKQRGFISSITETTQEEIARFASAKSKLTQLQKQQPSAVFSLNTPYALLTSKEYATQTMTPLSAGELTDLLASADLSAVATNTTAQSKAHFSTLAVDVPDVDWVRYGCVTRIQDQGACNAGYVFSVVGAIETGYCIKSPTRTLYDLSEQDPLTCGSYTSCRSGAPSFVYNWITTLNGGSLCTDASLPYTRGDFMSQPCTRYEDPNVWCNKPDLQVATFEQKQFADHRELEAIVRQRAVTAVVTPCPAFQYYSSGVLRGDEYNCPAPSDFNSPGTHHEVLIVGFGTRDGIPYWKVKNSDGTSWGEGGYAYIERGYQGGPFGAAGIEMWNTYPLFKSDVPNFDALRVTGPRYNVEIIGNDLKIVMIQMGLGEDCATICRREPGCKAYSLRNDGSRLCRLKSSVSGEVRYSFDQDGLLYYSGAVITRDEMKGYCLAPEYNYDFPGNDVDVAAASSPEQCCDLCFGNRLCEAYTWTQFHGGMCYLKSRRAVKPEWKAPASDGSAYFASGVVYKCQPLQFNTDFPGNDVESVQASGPMDCCGICRNSLKCVGFSWTNFNGGTCWLKSRIPASGIGSYANGVYAAAI